MFRRIAVAVAAGVLLLSGCGAGAGGSDDKSAAKSKGSAAQPDSGGGAVAPGLGGGDAEGAQKADPEARDFAPARDMVSTFALDVDTASYQYARRTIQDGRLPQPDTVRTEEFVNSFRQNYPEPEGDGFSVTTDGARAPGEQGWSLMRVGLATRSATNAYGSDRRAPAALTFVIDISGSMAEPGRLDLVREALRLTTDELRPDDSVAIVTFSDEADVLLPMTRLSEGNKNEVRAAIEKLRPTDSTNLAAGVELGYEQAVETRREGATNRVVLLSDALANTGETDADAILDRIGDARRDHGITLFGVGVGSDYGDELMERLTNHGDGHTSYVSDLDQARRVFVDQLPRNIDLRARDAKAQVRFDESTVEQFKLIGYENRAVADEDFRNDRVDGGEIGPGHTVTALYAVRLKEGASGHVATATVRWLDPKNRSPHEESRSIEAPALGGELWGGADERFQVAVLAAYFADALRGGTGTAERGAGATGPLPGAPTIQELSRRAAALSARLEDRQVTELGETIDRAVALVS
ncbi:von Willebrand factor type A domain-containing protein [Streptomyces sp. NPDC051940]|uniref:vWA domain-containing protein n=1 Tax=Streptomyces sp. NPDC051940 TaxID=3155675 RepID=UPI003449D7AC